MKGHRVFSASTQTKQFVKTVKPIFQHFSFLSRGTSHHFLYSPTQSQMSNNAVKLKSVSSPLAGNLSLTRCYLYELGT